MSSKQPLPERVEINQASAEEIERLRGIGPRLAQRIVEYRDGHGAFRRASDLAGVEGVSLSLAELLDQQIDWTVREESSTQGEKLWTLYLLLPAALGVWVTRNGYSNALAWFDETGDGARVQQVIACLNVAAGIVICIGVVLGAVSGLTSKPRVERFADRGVVVAWFGLGIIAVSIGVANAIWYERYAAGGWSDLVANGAAITGLILGVGFFGTQLLPLAALIWRPGLARNKHLARGVDVLSVGYAIALAWSVWGLRDVAPLWILGLIGLQAVFLALVSFSALTTQTSHLDTLVAFTTSLQRQDEDLSGRMEWLNRHFPKPEDQLELKRALDKAYPPSRSRTVGLAAAGTLCLAAAAGAVRALGQAAVNAVLT